MHLWLQHTPQALHLFIITIAQLCATHMSNQQVSIYCFKADGQRDTCQHITCTKQWSQQQQQQQQLYQQQNQQQLLTDQVKCSTTSLPCCIRDAESLAGALLPTL
jgi:hypothetical protein